MEGTYGIAVMSTEDPQKIVVARRSAPLLLGVSENGEGAVFVASDVAAILEHTRNVVYLEDNELAILRPGGCELLDLSTFDSPEGLRPIRKEISHVSWDLETIERAGYAHFMLKEIFEQPGTVRDACRGRLMEEEGTARLGGLLPLEADLDRVEQLILTACGTSWHAALVGEYIIEELARLPVEVEYASEFRYRNPVIRPHTMVAGISQSGETADTLAAIREARERGAKTMGIVNVVGSSVARETDGGVYTHAGPEIGVASTKAFVAQLTVLSLFGLYLGRRRELSILQGREIVRALRELPEKIEEVLETEGTIRELAEEFRAASNFLYLGRGPNFPIALEGALKLKEISY
ncbi:MAG: isomerizing glutamine--fructose-6-phosphate transaminase, partial [Gemmatimonadota bacterium]